MEKCESIMLVALENERMSIIDDSDDSQFGRAYKDALKNEGIVINVVLKEQSTARVHFLTIIDLFLLIHKIA